MNKEYIKELFEENKETFLESGMDISNPNDLEEMMISYITSNMQYDFDIDVLEDRLFDRNAVEQNLEEERIEHGERENYNLVTLIRLCEVLKIDFIHLLVLAGYLPSNQINNEDNITEMESLLDDEEDDINDEECDACPLCEPIEIVITLISGRDE